MDAASQMGVRITLGQGDPPVSTRSAIAFMDESRMCRQMACASVCVSGPVPGELGYTPCTKESGDASG